MNIIRSDLTAEVTPVTASPQLADIARSFGVTRQTASRYVNKVRVAQGEG